MPYKSRLQRFDEVFRTLLVIAAALSGIHLTSISRALLPAAFDWLLLLVAAITVWSIAALWGENPWASTVRIISLQMLSVYLVALFSELFVVFPLPVWSSSLKGSSLNIGS